MKNILCIGLIVFQMTVFAQNYPADFPQTDTIIKEDSMNFAVLVVDFATYYFHKANISYYTKCDNSCSIDSLPVKMYFDGWYDLARVYFYYKYDSSLLFGAWVYWMGYGNIFYPTSFIVGSNFPYTSNAVPLPADAEYYDIDLVVNYYTWDEYIARGQMAWKAIDSLEIVNQFAAKPFRVGLFAYSRGALFDPYKTDWIIFLYRGNEWPVQVQRLPEEQPFMICPNPAEGQAVFKLQSEKKEAGMRIKLYDIFGREVRVIDLPMGQKEYPIDVSGLPEGIYVAELLSENAIIGRQKMVVK
jgi:hypothetical protein